MADETEVSVEIGADDAPKTDAGGTPGGAAAATTTAPAAGGDVAEGIEELRAKLAESEQRRIAAESRAAGAGRSAEEVQRNSHLLTINGALEVLASQMSGHKAAYSAAMAAGDFDQAADIQEKMASNAAERRELMNGKAYIETRGPATGAPAPSSDRLEAIANGLTPKSAAWVRAHPEFARDEDKTNLMIAAHYKALAAKLPNESPEYFAFVEKELGIGHSDRRPAPNGADTVEVDTSAPALSAAAAPAQRRDTQPSAAPASRGTGSKRVIRLTPQEVEAAKISGMSNEEYARNKMREEERKKTTH